MRSRGRAGSCGSRWRRRRDGDVVMRLDDAVVGGGSFRLGPVDLEIGWAERRHRRPQRLGQDHAVAGAARRPAARRGTRWIGPGVVVGEMDQARMGFETDARLIDAFVAETHLVTAEARSLLEVRARRGARAAGRRHALTGRAHTATLAWFAAQGVNCLVLDEPTNSTSTYPRDRAARAILSATTAPCSRDARSCAARRKVRITRPSELEDQPQASAPGPPPLATVRASSPSSSWSYGVARLAGTWTSRICLAWWSSRAHVGWSSLHRGRDWRGPARCSARARAHPDTVKDHRRRGAGACPVCPSRGGGGGGGGTCGRRRRGRAPRSGWAVARWGSAAVPAARPSPPRPGASGPRRRQAGRGGRRSRPLLAQLVEAGGLRTRTASSSAPRAPSDTRACPSVVASSRSLTWSISRARRADSSRPPPSITTVSAPRLAVGKLARAVASALRARWRVPRGRRPRPCPSPLRRRALAAVVRGRRSSGLPGRRPRRRSDAAVLTRWVTCSVGLTARRLW